MPDAGVMPRGLVAVVVIEADVEAVGETVALGKDLELALLSKDHAKVVANGGVFPPVEIQ